MDDETPVFGPKDRPKKILTRAEALAAMGHDKDMRGLVEMGLVFIFEDQDGTLRVGLTRRGLASSQA